MSSTTGSSAFADDDTEESRGLRAIILDDGRILHWLGRTPVQTFILCPLAVVGFEFARQGAEMTLMLSGIPLLLWGYLQYRFVGRYRRRLGGGGPGMEAPPAAHRGGGSVSIHAQPDVSCASHFHGGPGADLLVVVRVILLVLRAGWFHYRVLGDEERLEAKFGADYTDYRKRVKRWIPGLL
jgi:hypothetical protein